MPADRQRMPAGVPIRFALRPGANTLCLGWNAGAILGLVVQEPVSCVDVVDVAP